MIPRFPIILDTDDNTLKELPAGDSLNLLSCDVEGATEISANRITAQTVNADIVEIDGIPLGTVAQTNDYNDLENTPRVFSGKWQDITNKPSIPQSLDALSDVETYDSPQQDDIIKYNAQTETFEVSEFDFNIESYQLSQLGDVNVTGNPNDTFLKFANDAWEPSAINYADVNGRPQNLSDLSNDLEFISKNSLEADLIYSVADSQNWSSPAPSTVFEALDRIAAVLASTSQKP